MFLLSTCGCNSMYWKAWMSWREMSVGECPVLITRAASSHMTSQDVFVVAAATAQSGLFMISNGLPQGSAGGPLVFTLYINNIRLSSQCSNVHFRWHSFMSPVSVLHYNGLQCAINALQLFQIPQSITGFIYIHRLNHHVLSNDS